MTSHTAWVAKMVGWRCVGPPNDMASPSWFDSQKMADEKVLAAAGSVG